MASEVELRKLLANMRPELQEGEFVFCVVPPELFRQLRIEPIGWFRESEGITIIVDRGIADSKGLKYQSVFRMIALTVHSSLDAVGFLAAITEKLASAGVPVNPVSGYYHDHLFVPSEKANTAVRLLNEMMSDAS